MANRSSAPSRSRRDAHSPFRFLSHLRRDSDEHPLVLLALIAAIAAATATLFPPSGPSAFAGDVSIYAERASAKPFEFDVRAPSWPVDPIAACRGQSWGEEQAECLSAITRSAGRLDRLVRIVAADEQTAAEGPSIF